MVRAARRAPSPISVLLSQVRGPQKIGFGCGGERHKMAAAGISDISWSGWRHRNMSDGDVAQGDVEPGRKADSTAKIFISYSRRDMAFVDRLEPALTARGFQGMIDRQEIYAFEDWGQRLQALINQADTVVFALIPEWLSSQVCRQEIEYASSLNKRFAPIVCRSVDPKEVPEALSRLNFILFTDEGQYEQSLNRLVAALETDIGWLRQHTEFGEYARRWDES